MYKVAQEQFPTKIEVTRRCQHIIDTTEDYKPVFDRFVPFLTDIFAYLDDWQEQSATMKHIFVHTTYQGARCFAIKTRAGCSTDINHKKAICLMLPVQEVPLTKTFPSDYLLAAKASIACDIDTFQQKQFLAGARCPVSGALLNKKNSRIEYLPHWTFDNLLFRFTKQNEIDPFDAVESPRFDKSQSQLVGNIATEWRELHRKLARLRITSLFEARNSRGSELLTKADPAWTTLLDLAR